LVGWEINVPFQHKNRLHQGQGLGWLFSSARLRMANDTVTSQRRCLFVQRQPKMGRIVEAHLSYYARPIYQFNMVSYVIAVHQFQ